MMRVRRNAFAAGKNGDANPTEAPSSLDYSHDEVFDMVPSSHGMVLQSDAEGVESASPSCSHLTEVQVQGIKITLSTSSRANISMGSVFGLKKYRKSARAYFLLNPECVFSTLMLYYG